MVIGIFQRSSEVGLVQFWMGLWDDPLFIDILVKGWGESLRSPGMDHFFQRITHFGSPYAFIILCIAMVICLSYRGKIRAGLILGSGLTIAWQSMNYLKQLFGRVRPPGEHLTYATGESFPSGHAMLSLVFYGFIAYLALKYLSPKTRKIAAALLTLLVILIGFSRVYLNVHYASDVLAGFGFGAVFLWLMIVMSHRADKPE